MRPFLMGVPRLLLRSLAHPRQRPAAFQGKALRVPKATLIAPVKAGDVIGKVEIRNGDKVIKQADLVAQENVEQGGFFRRMWDSIRLFFKGLFG